MSKLNKSINLKNNINIKIDNSNREKKTKRRAPAKKKKLTEDEINAILENMENEGSGYSVSGGSSGGSGGSIQLPSHLYDKEPHPLSIVSNPAASSTTATIYTPPQQYNNNTLVPRAIQDKTTFGYHRPVLEGFTNANEAVSDARLNTVEYIQSKPIIHPLTGSKDYHTQPKITMIRGNIKGSKRNPYNTKNKKLQAELMNEQLILNKKLQDISLEYPYNLQNPMSNPANEPILFEGQNPQNNPTSAMLSSAETSPVIQVSTAALGNNPLTSKKRSVTFKKNPILNENPLYMKQSAMNNPIETPAVEVKKKGVRGLGKKTLEKLRQTEL